MINPYVYLVAALVWLLTLAGSGWGGFQLGRDTEVAIKAREEKVAQIAGQAAAASAAGAIAKLEVKRVEITQRVQTRIQQVPVYRDCRHDERVLGDVNEALTGRRPDPSGLPGSGPAH